MKMPDIISGVLGTILDQHLPCVQAARKLLSRERQPPINDIIEAGIIDRMVEFLAHNDR